MAVHGGGSSRARWRLFSTWDATTLPLHGASAECPSGRECCRPAAYRHTQAAVGGSGAATGADMTARCCWAASRRPSGRSCGGIAVGSIVGGTAASRQEDSRRPGVDLWQADGQVSDSELLCCDFDFVRYYRKMNRKNRNPTCRFSTFWPTDRLLIPEKPKYLSTKKPNRIVGLNRMSTPMFWWVGLGLISMVRD
jgi:hypothetical protein